MVDMVWRPAPSGAAHPAHGTARARVRGDLSIAGRTRSGLVASRSRIPCVQSVMGWAIPPSRDLDSTPAGAAADECGAAEEAAAGAAAPPPFLPLGIEGSRGAAAAAVDTDDGSARRSAFRAFNSSFSSNHLLKYSVERCRWCQRAAP